MCADEEIRAAVTASGLDDSYSCTVCVKTNIDECVVGDVVNQHRGRRSNQTSQVIGAEFYHFVFGKVSGDDCDFLFTFGCSREGDDGKKRGCGGVLILISAERTSVAVLTLGRESVCLFLF